MQTSLIYTNGLETCLLLLLVVWVQKQAGEPGSALHPFSVKRKGCFGNYPPTPRCQSSTAWVPSGLMDISLDSH